MSTEHFRFADRHAKPEKPYPEFPLFAHGNGCWAKKIRGKLHYFGRWDQPDAALARYLEQKDALHSGRTPRPDAAAASVRDSCNGFLRSKRAAVDNGELSPRTWAGYKEASDAVIEAFGKGRLAADLGPDDFAALRVTLARRYGPHRLGTVIQCVRCLFKHAYDADLIDRPMRFGPGFKRPSKKTLRLHRAKQGPKLFTAGEVRQLIDAAGLQLRAMVLLAINGGLGNSDVGNLPLSALDLDNGFLDFPRPKTGIPRRCPLWVETVEALRGAIKARKEPRGEADADKVFVTKYGTPFAKDSDPAVITKEFGKLLRKLGINGRAGRNFYTLRHTFRTVGDEARDQPAADYIMGHEVPHMSSVYRETISDARLRAVTETVHQWLFGTLPPA